MRVKRIQTTNFAGLGSIELNDLDTHDELFVSGRNGIGKSQLLLCIALASRNDVSMQEAAKYVGPGGKEAEIVVDFSLQPEELAQFNEVAKGHGNHQPLTEPLLRAKAVLSLYRATYSQWQDTQGNAAVTSVMSDPIARELLSFTDVTYLPADRVVARSPELTFSLASLARSKSLELGQQTLTQQISDWNQSHSFDVFSSLAALHYAGILAREPGAESSPQLDDFFAIVSAFKCATGKTILEPMLKDDGSIGLLVEVSDGYRHNINTLSSGELVALQLLHFVKMHFYRGSVLLIDEPEQHLHPSLQVEIANAAREGVGAGQLWVVTHSPNLLNAVPARDVLALRREESTGITTAGFADSDSRQIALFQELGVAPGLWVPGNFLAVVEGSTDTTYLRQLLPEFFSKAYFVVAGDSSSVRSIASRMDEYSTIPYTAICDRDRRPERDFDDWNKSPNRFMWSGYAIESVFLDATWVSATLCDTDPQWTVAKVKEHLHELFEQQYSKVLDMWLREELQRRVPSQDDHKATLKEATRTAVQVAIEREEFVEKNHEDLVEEFDEAWKARPEIFVDPKRVLRQFRSNIYSSKDVLVAAMIAKLNRDPSLAPNDLLTLREKLEKMSIGIEL